MSKADFDAFVTRQQDQAGKADFDPQQHLREWLNKLAALHDQIQGYLRPYIERGAAKITVRDISLNEEFIGDYTAQELILSVGSSTVTFTPVGTMLIGTRGRVDVQGSLGTARLLLIDKSVADARQLVRVTVRRVGDPPPDSPPEHERKQVEWIWKLATPPPDMKFEELTEDTFFNMILAVANG